ncbi:OmpA family protein [Aminobacter sp. HY435]|uniref:OmpA family protein n=1 Tax=Aminobacter sp. HY435 TaxID=2970917 RepID=UPI0022B9CBF2|nr:OmpA family protein [Aminobacter sp. HY435]
MKRQPRILAGTAIGLFMASAPLGAMPLPAGPLAANGQALPLVRVQAECQDGESAEACAARQGGGQQEQAPAQEQAPEPAPQPEPQPAPEPQPEAQQPAPEPQAEEPAPRRKQRQQPAAEEAAPQEAAPEPQAEEPAPRRKQRREQPAAEEAAPQQEQEAAPQAAPAPEPQAEEPAPKRRPKREPAAEAPAQEQPAQEQPAQEQPAQTPEVAPQPEQQPQAEQPAQPPADKPAQPTPEQVPTPAPSPETQAPAGEAPAPTEQPTPSEQPATGEQPAQPGEQPAAGEQPQQPATGEQPQQPATGEQQPAQQGEAPVNPNEAPILDSAKEAPPAQDGAGQQPAQEGQPAQPAPEGQGGAQTAQPQPQPVDQGPPPVDDKAATEQAQPAQIQPVTAEKGTRLERAPEIDLRRRPRPEGSEVLREIGDRVIIQLNNQIFVESNDRPRLTRDAQEVYYDELPGGRTREVIVRENGNQIITIRNRYGDVVQRSRITPDGREYVLSYVDDRYYADMDEWRDPGLDLPPLQLHIPRNEYILESEYVDGPDDYYDFLEQPPVERVKRLYSVDEVKRSARVRDIARRVDLDTLNFEFGSASIPEAEVNKLEGVANAMDKLLQKNPAETFLIEGHTDAVGSDVANLALSDRRAEAVADALTNVFGIPPENLSTQGYGERYLKVKTDQRERENRRVAIRRITPLVAPVASAK